jgi:glycosyltransferase involved in cell wall biosynthesis
MKIGIYNPYMSSISGGEKYTLIAASCLSRDSNVDIFWDDKSILDKATRKLNIKLSGVKVKENIFKPYFSKFKRLRATAKYDLLFILSDGSIPFSLARRTIIHFQSPLEDVNPEALITKFKLRRIDKFICNSYFTKKFIDRKYKIKSSVLYPPCITRDETKNSKNYNYANAKENIIITVGRYSRLNEGSIKKFEKMIDVYKKMIDSGLKNWQFNIIVSYKEDDKKYIEAMEKSVENYPLTILKNCSFPELKEQYKKAKIYWHAAGFDEDLQKHPDRAEHFGITTVEAMANGVIPVVFAGGGQTEIVSHGIDGFQWKTEDELILYTKKLMIDNFLISDMSQQTTKKSLQFTTEIFCQKLNKLITN